MPAPCLKLQHLKTSTQYEKGNKINRYWFQWSDRTQNKAMAVRLELLGADGVVITSASLQLPKVKVTGYSPATPDSPEKPIYDSTVFIQFDDIVRELPATSFRYRTVDLFKKSDEVTGVMDGIFEDISHLG